MSIEITKIQRLTSPNPFCLITSQKEDGSTNIMALSWWTYVSNHPATVAVCLSGRGYTKDLIRRSGEFGLCLPDVSLAAEAVKCGRISGRELDKAASYGIRMEKAEEISADLVAESEAAIECRVVEEMEAGDHILFVAQVAAVRMKPEYRHLYALDGYATLGPA